MRRKDVPATDDMSVARVRGLLEQTFARFGYARVPDPGQPPDMQVLLLHEFARLLARNENVLSRADTRPKLARAFGDILAAAKAKVAHDSEWAARYADERTTEYADIVRSAGRVPADWKDL